MYFIKNLKIVIVSWSILEC